MYHSIKCGTVAAFAKEEGVNPEFVLEEGEKHLLISPSLTLKRRVEDSLKQCGSLKKLQENDRIDKQGLPPSIPALPMGSSCFYGKTTRELTSVLKNAS